MRPKGQEGAGLRLWVFRIFGQWDGGRSGKKEQIKISGEKTFKKRDCRDVFSSVILCGAFCGIPYFRFRKGGGWDCGRIPGLACLVVAVAGFVLGIVSLREPDILYFQPVFGVAVNALIMVALISLYLTGMM